MNYFTATTSILGSVFLFTIALLLKYKKARKGRFLKESAKIGIPSYFFMGIGMLLWGIHELFAYYFYKTVSLHTIGTIFLFIGLLFPSIRKKETEDNSDRNIINVFKKSKGKEPFDSDEYYFYSKEMKKISLEANESGIPLKNYLYETVGVRKETADALAMVWNNEISEKELLEENNELQNKKTRRFAYRAFYIFVAIVAFFAGFLVIGSAVVIIKENGIKALSTRLEGLYLLVIVYFIIRGASRLIKSIKTH